MSERTERIKKNNEEFRRKSKSNNKLFLLLIIVFSIVAFGIFQVVTAEPEASKDDWNLIVVNMDKKLPKSFKVDLANFNGLRVDSRIKDNIELLLNNAEKDGIKIGIRSSYRSIKNQEYLYNIKLNLYKEKHPKVKEKDAKKYLNRYISPSRHSEYHTGLLINFVASDDGSSFNKKDSAILEKWLSQNAEEYGFVRRFTRGKSKLTGKYASNTIYRYVGEDNAKYMNKKGLCLEEYVKLLK